jgi:hypothetical protein
MNHNPERDTKMFSRPNISRPTLAQVKSRIRPRIGKRAAAGLLVVAVGLGIFGGGAAHAQPIEGHTGANCTYAGLDYSEGSVIKMEDGLTYKCSGGEWKRTSRIAPPSRPMAPLAGNQGFMAN